MGIIQLGCYIANKFWWIPWSNFRFRHEERFNVAVDDEFKIFDLTIGKQVTSHNTDNRYRAGEILQGLAKKLYSKFEYTNDGADQLWDAVLPPPYAYKQFSNNEKYKEDCDGFHSLLLNCLHATGIPAYLTVVWARGSGHCVLVCHLGGFWYLVDYTNVYSVDGQLSELIEKYNEEFVKIYKGCKSKVLYNCFLGYNYKKGKFYMANPEKELKKSE